VSLVAATAKAGKAKATAIATMKFLIISSLFTGPVDFIGHGWTIEPPNTIFKLVKELEPRKVLNVGISSN
jgi:hypothetical protein